MSKRERNYISFRARCITKGFLKTVLEQVKKNVQTLLELRSFGTSLVLNDQPQIIIPVFTITFNISSSVDINMLTTYTETLHLKIM